MNRLLLCGVLPLLASACGVEVEVQTSPISASIPITSVGVDNYAEVAVDLPTASRGDIQVKEISADVIVNNASSASTITLSLRVSGEGQATPDVPRVYGPLKPSYYDKAIVLVPPTDFAPGASTPIHVDATAVKTLINLPRIYLLATNTVSKQGIGELGLKLNLKDARLHAVVTKSLQSANGAVDLTGL